MVRKYKSKEEGKYGSREDAAQNMNKKSRHEKMAYKGVTQPEINKKQMPVNKKIR